MLISHYKFELCIVVFSKHLDWWKQRKSIQNSWFSR